MADTGPTEAALSQMREWLAYNLAAGCEPADLQASLIENGFEATEAEAFIRAELTRLGELDGGPFDAAPATGAEAAGRYWARSDVLTAFNQLALGDRVVRSLARAPEHGVHFVAGFLSDDECDALIAEAEGRMEGSRIIDEVSGGTLSSHTRSSRGALLQRGLTDTIRAIESRIARLTDLPIGHGEALQILHYGQGGEYRPHFDYFDPDSPGGARVLARDGQRAVTVILYLNDVEGGGGTVFPDLGLEVTPLKGAALVFPSLGRDGAPLASSLHAGAPVVSGEKWIATKWIRSTAQAGGR